MARTRKNVVEAPAMPATSAAAEADRDRIAQRAYELYEARGAEPGRELDDWLTAERELVGSTDNGGAR